MRVEGFFLTGKGHVVAGKCPFLGMALFLQNCVSEAKHRRENGIAADL